MKHNMNVLGLLASLVVVGCATTEVQRPTPVQEFPNSALEEKYFIHAGDVLKVRVFTGTTVDSENDYTVQPDGNIHPTLLDNQVMAGGSDLNELSKTLSGLYGKYIKNVRIEIVPVTMVPRSVYVGGEVTRPEAIPYTGRMLTVLDAVVAAGWLTYDGDPENVIVIRRPTSGKRPIATSVNLNLVVENQDPAHNLALMPDDLVIVPKTGIGNANKFIDQYIRRMLPGHGSEFGILYGGFLYGD